MSTRTRQPTATIVNVLASRLRLLRQEKGLSQEQLADCCGLHRTYVGSVERGERNITLSSLEALAGALGVRVVDLLNEDASR